MEPADLGFDDLMAAGDRVLVAVSGGVDSLSLLHLLVGRRKDLAVELVAAHIHHGMRGESADADVEFLRPACAQWNVPVEVVYVDVPALAAVHGVGIEEAGRLARYEAFAALAQEHGCNKVATAHHADDQVETLLLHLLRGTGLDGLRGMPERRPLYSSPDAPELIRPLLGVWRHELEAYCRDHGLQPRHDVTNDDPHYRRNRLRHELMPLLDSLAPAARQNLLRLTRHAQEEVAVLDPLAQDLLDRSRAGLDPDECPAGVPAWLVRDRVRTVPRLQATVLAGASPALARRALRLWLRECASQAPDLSLKTFDQLLGLVTADSGETAGAIDLPQCGLRVRRQGGYVQLETQHSTPAVPQPVPIPGSGSHSLPEYGLTLSLEEAPAPANLRLPPDQACLDAARIQGALRLRPPDPGDRFQPLGAPGSRLLSDLFIDRKIPAPARASWPVLEDAAGILWVCGLVIAERARVTITTAACLRLALTPVAGPLP